MSENYRRKSDSPNITDKYQNLKSSENEKDSIKSSAADRKYSLRSPSTLATIDEKPSATSASSSPAKENGKNILNFNLFKRLRKKTARSKSENNLLKASFEDDEESFKFDNISPAIELPQSTDLDALKISQANTMADQLSGFFNRETQENVIASPINIPNNLISQWNAPESWAVKYPSVTSLNQSFSGSSTSFQANFIKEHKELLQTNPISDVATIKSTAISSVANLENSLKFVDEPFLLTKYEQIASSQAIDLESKMGLAATIRVFKPVRNVDRAESGFKTISCSLCTTTKELLEILYKKFFVAESDRYNLYVTYSGLERLLEPDEFPLHYQRKWLIDLGYSDTDQLAKIEREDNSYVFRFIFSEYPTPSPLYTDYLINSHQYPKIKQDSKNGHYPEQNLQMLPILLFRNAHTLESLDFSRNLMIKSVPSDFASSLHSLRSLKMSGNLLKTISPALSLIPSLTHLDLSCNELNEHVLSPLFSLSKITHLSLESNRLRNIPPEIQNLKSLRFLDISSNLFEFFPETIFVLYDLRELNISFNKIPEIPSRIDGLKNLRALICLSNLLTGFPPELSNLQYLRLVEAQSNYITDISSLSGCNNLQDLSINHNRITSFLPGSLDCLTQLNLNRNVLTEIQFSSQLAGLRSLNLSFGKLVSLPSNIFTHVPYLQKLIMDDNSLTTLPSSISSLRSLKHFSAVNNKIDDLPESINLLEALVYLDLRGNNIKKLSPSIWTCKTLSYLNLSSNLLNSFPFPSKQYLALVKSSLGFKLGPLEEQETENNASYLTVPRRTSIEATPTIDTNSNVGSLERSWSQTVFGSPKLTYGLSLHLKELYLGDNNLMDDSVDALQYLFELEVLNLSMNEITDIGDAFKQMSKLSSLHLSYNQLNSLPDDIHLNEKLRILYVDGNKLTTIPVEVGELSELVVFDASNNNLKYNVCNWPYDWNWNYNHQLRYLNLSGNRRLMIKSSDRDNKDLCDFNKLRYLESLDLSQVRIYDFEKLPLGKRYFRLKYSTSHNEHPSALSVGISDAPHRDAHFFTWTLSEPRFLTREHEILCGLFDGRNSSQISYKLYESFSYEFSTELRSLRREEGPDVALRRCFLNLNKEISISGGVENDSSCAVVVYISENKIYVANVGDAIAVLSRSGVALCVSTKHHPWNRNEVERIKRLGGFVSSDGLVQGEIPLTRVIGAHHLLPYVIAAPFIHKIDISEGDEFIVIGNNALWNCMSYQTAIDIARGLKESPQLAAQRIRDYALSYGAEGISVVVLNIKTVLEDEKDQDLYDFKVKRGAKKDTISDSTLKLLGKEIPAPAGEVTLVFTDIKNSTVLWSTQFAAMDSAIRTHHYLMRRLFRSLGGYECKNEGDAFMIAFSSVFTALKYCLLAQLQLMEADWPPQILNSKDGQIINDSEGNLIYRGLSVRMGMHVGHPIDGIDPVTHRTDYHGPVVIKAARTSSQALGGQITLSSDAYAAYLRLTDAEKRELYDATVFPLGPVTLKGINEKEFLYAMYPGSLATRHFFKEDSESSPVVSEENRAFMPTHQSEKMENIQIETEDDQEYLVNSLHSIAKRLNTVIATCEGDREDSSFVSSESCESHNVNSCLDILESQCSALELSDLGTLSSAIRDIRDSFALKDPIKIKTSLENYYQRQLQRK